MITNNNKWTIKNKSTHNNPFSNDFNEEITLEYIPDMDLFELSTIPFDGEQEKDTIVLYPKDLPTVHKVIGNALKEATNADWWDNNSRGSKDGNDNNIVGTK